MPRHIVFRTRKQYQVSVRVAEAQDKEVFSLFDSARRDTIPIL